jgi:predicted DNA-binding protein
MYTVIEIQKTFRNKTTILREVVDTTQFSNDYELAELACDIAERDDDGNLNGFSYSWNHCTDSKIIKETIENKILELNSKITKLQDQLNYLTEFTKS